MSKFRYEISSREECDKTNWPRVEFVYYYRHDFINENFNITAPTKSNLLVLSGDEFCNCSIANCRREAHREAHHNYFWPVRQYYSALYDDLDNSSDSDKDSYISSSSSHGIHARGLSLYLPLGSRLDFGIVNQDEIRMGESRRFLFNIIVSPTSQSRIDLIEFIKVSTYKENKYHGVISMKSSYNSSLAPGNQSSFSLNQHFFKNSSYFLHITPEWNGTFGAESKGFIGSKQYKQVTNIRNHLLA